MTGDDLDRSYTALCEAIGRVGRDRATLLLATFGLALMARETHADEVVRLIEQSERLTLQDSQVDSRPAAASLPD